MINARYECALIRNKIEKIPVVPVFLAELDENNPSSFIKFARDAKFPSSMHARNPSSQAIIDKLWYVKHKFKYFILEF